MLVKTGLYGVPSGNCGRVFKHKAPVTRAETRDSRQGSAGLTMLRDAMLPARCACHGLYIFRLRREMDSWAVQYRSLLQDTIGRQILVGLVAAVAKPQNTAC
jgi:hypothetical protein